MFLANLNVFLAGSIILTLVGGSLVALALMPPLSLLSKALSVDSSWTLTMSYFAIPLTLGIVWLRRGLVPTERAPERELRYRRGQRLLFLANVSVVTSVFLPLALAIIGGRSEYSLFGFFLTPLLGLGAIGGLIGLFMVWTSGAPPRPAPDENSAVARPERTHVRSVSGNRGQPNVRSWRRRLNLLARFVVVAAIACGAFLAYDARYPSWKEEVQLSDGRMVVVRQKHRYYENHGTAESWVTFSLPEMGGEQTWHSYLKPMRVDVSDGMVYAFGRPRGHNQITYYRHPRHFIVAFKWNGEKFERIPFMSVPSHLRVSENVFPCVPDQRYRKWTWERKERWWCAPSDSKGLLRREINLDAYDAIAEGYARRARWRNTTE